MMKMLLEERTKHRLVGLAVILSVIAIVLPAVMKKTTQPFDNMSRVTVRIPPKPSQPDVKMADEKAMFNAMKVSHIDVPQLPAQHASSAQLEVKSLAKTETKTLASKPQVASPKPQVIRAQAPQQETLIAKKEARTPIIPQKSPAVTDNGFAVQVASFSNPKNANALVKKLKTKGYAAHYSQIAHAKGTRYNVLVGHAVKRNDLLPLQQELASQMQLKGFVVDINLG